MSATPVAVVVIGRNEAGNLDRCFSSVQAMDYPADCVELVYVDSGSVDGSVAVAQRWGARIILLREPPYNAARGRQAGWTATSAPFVLFLDGDCEVASGFASRALKEFEDPRVATVWGQLSEASSEGSFLQDMLGLRYRGLPTGRGPLMGGNHVCRRSALEAVGGYDLGLESMENADLGRRLREKGYLVVRVDKPAVTHHVRTSGWRGWLRRGFRFGYGDARFLARAPSVRLHFRDYYDIGPRFTDVLLFLAFLVSSLTSVTVWSWRGLPIAALLLLALVAAKAWFSRRKAKRWTTRLLYALHANMFSVPMAFGHLVFWFDFLRGRSREIDYWQKPGSSVYGNSSASRGVSKSLEGSNRG